MINNNSRYKADLWERDGVVYSIATKKGKEVVKQTMNIVSVEGDTFEKIAARVYGDSTQYWRIAGINSVVRFPDIIPTGTVIAIPIL